MSDLNYITKLGVGRLSFSPLGIRSLELPSKGCLPSDDDNVNRSGKENALKAARLLERYFGGEDVSFDEISLDYTGKTDFFKTVCNAVRSIEAGELMTYAQVAEAAGKKGAARAVGRVMAKNPVPIIVPCHRVVASDGTLRGYSAEGGLKTKAMLLRMEGLDIPEEH